MSEQCTFLPVPTCEVTPPILELQKVDGRGKGALPRIFLERLGRGRGRRRVLHLAVLFLLLVGGELAILLGLPPAAPLVVYRELPRCTLVGGAP